MSEKKRIKVNPMMPTEQAAQIAKNTWESSAVGQEQRRRWTEKKAGDEMPDGTVYLGRHSGKDVFLAPEDIRDSAGKRLTMTFNEVAEHIKTFKSCGYDDWTIPGNDILLEMFNHRSTGRFGSTYKEDENGSSYPDYPNWYWSCTEYPARPFNRQVVRFSDGLLFQYDESTIRMSCRPVRLVPAL